MLLLDFLSSLDFLISGILDSLGLYGPILGCMLILVESILPILPLSVFITMNFYAFGNFLGFIISLILTVIGCNIAFLLSRKFLKTQNKISFLRVSENKMTLLIKKFSNIKLKNLVILMAFPFTPAFLINVLSGISEISQKKFAIAALIAKPFMVYFWGYIGTTFLQSLKHPEYFFKIFILLSISYILSLIVNRQFKLD